jgi:hypothetical protein
MKLVISLATRGRPSQLIETVRRSTANLVLPNTVMQLQVDSDDHATIEALDKAQGLDKRVKVNVKDREDTIAAKWNRATKIPADVYLVAADDDPYITPGYDGKLLDAAGVFPDGIGMVYGHMANASFSGVVAPTIGLVEKLGAIFPEHFPYWFCDHWTDDVAKIIGRISFADVRTDQSNVGRTQEMREPGWWATWFDAAYLVRRYQAYSIIDGKDFKSPAWLKTMLKSQAPLIEYRSRWVNEHVRQNPQLRSWSLPTADERYQRVRSKAVEAIPSILAGLPPEQAEAFRRALLPSNTVVSLQRAYG